jgi:type IV pilus assembly protein PilC
VAAVQYAYKVRDSGGKLIEGRVESESEAAVAVKLRSMGYLPLEIARANAGMRREIHLGLPRRVRLKDLAVFCRQFATMVNAGLSLLRSLAILAEQAENAELRRLLRQVRQDVEVGMDLSAAFARHPAAFPPLLVNMVQAGEIGGFLDVAMRQIAENYEAEVRLRGKIKAAMTYPVVVFVMAILMCVGMLLFVVPVFKDMFAGLGGELPAPTRLLVMLSEGLRFGAPALLVVSVAALLAWRRYARTERVRAVVDPLKLRLPVFGNLFRKIALARFARNLSTLLTSGVPVLQSLDVVAETTGSVVVEQALRAAQETVRRGESLSSALGRHPVFPPIVVHMLSSGEETGAVDQMLRKISEFYDEEVEATTESLTSLIEPLMIAFLGVVVGSMIVALYLPIFKIFDLVQ